MSFYLKKNGEIPPYWQVGTIIEVCENIIDYRGKTPTFSPYGVIHLRSSNIKNGQITLDNPTYVSEQTYKSFMTRGFPKVGDVIFTTEGPLGEAAIVPPNFLFSLAQRMIILQAKQNILDSLYFMYALYSKKVRDDYLGRATGSTVKGISSKSFQNVKIPLPPLSEQRAIGRTLRAIHQAKEVRQRELKLERECKAALLDYLFTHGTRSESSKQTGIGEIPESWQIVKLSSICTKITDGAHFTPSYKSSGIPFLRVVDIQGRKIDWNDVKYIPENEHIELIKRCKPEYGDVLLSKNGTIGKTKVVDWQEEFSIFVSLCLLKPKHNVVNSYYLSEFLASKGLTQIIKRGKKMTVTNLHLVEIKELSIPLPDIEEQLNIVSLLRACDKKIYTIEQEVELLDELFHAMLEELMTGRLSAIPLIDMEKSQ